MSVTITLNDTLAARLQSQAEAQHLSVEELALHILGEAVANEEAAEWRAYNQRRTALIRKQFIEGLDADEAGELQRLQDMADQHVERFDERMLADVTQLYRQAKRIIEASSGYGRTTNHPNDFVQVLRSLGLPQQTPLQTNSPHGLSF